MPHAEKINKARLEHLVSLGLDLDRKRVLEVGAGIGKLTKFFENRGCSVLSTDGRPENVEENIRRHPWREDSVHVVDMIQQGSHDGMGRFDVVFCYGALYHLSKPALCIADLAHVCVGLFLLETYVWKSDDGKVHKVKERASDSDQSLHGKGCRPARDWVWAELGKHFEYVYLTRTQPWYYEYRLSLPTDGRARAIFVASRDALELETLSPVLLKQQERFGRS
jgi:SAM-dependent methyltransferase